MVNKGRILRVEMEVVVHDTADDDEISEALEHHLKCEGGVSLENPLCHGDWDVASLDWEDTGQYALYSVNVINAGEDGSARYQVRTICTSDARTAEEAEGWRSQDDVIREAISKFREDAA